MRVLFLTHRLPYAPNRGDRVRAFHIVRTLARHVDLEVISLAHDDDELSQVERLRAMGMRAAAFRTPVVMNYLRGAAALTGTRPLTHCLLDAPRLKDALRATVSERPPDVVLAYCSGMARFAMEPPLDRIPLVLDLVDVDSEKWRALAGTAAWPIRRIYDREARHLARFERDAACRAASTLVVNERERDTLALMAPGAHIHVIRNGVDFDGLRPTTAPVEAPRVVFCGVMNYQPNVEGVMWFARDVWPLIRARRSDATFVIVGSSPTKAVRELISEENGIEVTGTVPDVREHLWKSAMSVAPLSTARGLQNKVLEAVAAGLPTVATTQVFEGLPAQIRGGACRVANTAEEFAGHVLELLELSGSERRAIADRTALADLKWDAQLATLPRILSDAAERS